MVVCVGLAFAHFSIFCNTFCVKLKIFFCCFLTRKVTNGSGGSQLEAALVKPKHIIISVGYFLDLCGALSDLSVFILNIWLANFTVRIYVSAAFSSEITVNKTALRETKAYFVIICSIEH